MNEKQVARGLGWFSLGLGLYEAAAPGKLGRSLGLEGREGLLRFYGLREIMAGVGIFSSQPRPAGWLWARVGGDAMSLATLLPALRPNNPQQGNAKIALGVVVGVTLRDLWCAWQLSREAED